jgi:hypothetical protein
MMYYTTYRQTLNKRHAMKIMTPQERKEYEEDIARGQVPYYPKG